MSDAPVLVTREGAVGIVTLNRPDKRNALDAATIAGLKIAIAELELEDGIRIIALRGVGKDFCAGADLAQLERIAAGADAMDNLHDAQSLGELFIRMRHASKPIVALVHGNAIAGGAGLANACDLVLARDDAMFGYPEVHLGFVPAMVMALLIRSVGEKVAFQLVASGHSISAEVAEEMGLVNEVYYDDEFESGTLAYLHDLAKRSPSALALTKRLLYGMDGMSFEQAIARGAEINALARSTADCQAGVRRFLERSKES